jgi:peptide/nickel transport system ATP-binding protein
MSEPLLSIRDLVVSFPGEDQPVQVVRGISMDAFAGKTLGIVGESGSGKSMSALAVLGLVPMPGRIQGSIRFRGRELVGLTEAAYEKIRGSEISVVFQDPSTSLNPVFSIEEQLVETIVQHKGVGQAEARALAVESLKHVEIPSPEKRIKDYPHQFSGGMKQRIMIAMALACEPSCLILDEPTTALDVTVQSQILDLVERIQNLNKMAIILISHDLGIISEIAHEVAVMYAGTLVETGPIEKILSQPRHPYTRGLMDSIPKLGIPKCRLQAIPGMPPDPGAPPSGCLFHPRCPRKLDRCCRDIPVLDRNELQAYACWNPEVIGGKSVFPEKATWKTSTVSPDASQGKEPILISLDHVGKDYPVHQPAFSSSHKKIVAVDEVSLSLAKGQTLGLVGESGSGKSTLARLICRLEDSSRGRIFFNDVELHLLKGEPLRKFRRHFQPVFQDHHGSLNPRMTVREILREPLELHGKPFQDEQIIRLLERTGLGHEILGRFAHQLSGGQRQRLGLARALAVEPDLLVADEPLSSLDVSIQAQILNLFLDFQEQLHLTLIFISHDLRVVGHLADCVAVMYAGRIMETALTRDLFNHPRHPYTWALLEALPKLQPGRGRVRSILKGDLPSTIDPAPGCRFHSRCRFRQDACLAYPNELLAVNESHHVACRRWNEPELQQVGENLKIADNK